MNFRLVAFVFFVVASLLVQAEDPDKDVDHAINEAANAAKKMGVKMPDVKTQLEEIDQEEGEGKSRFAETARSAGTGEATGLDTESTAIQG